MSLIADVVVGFKEGVLSCEPETLKLYYITGPSSVEWTFESLPAGTARVSITFEGQEQVFRDVAVSSAASGPLKIMMFSYIGGPRIAKYTIRCYDAEGTVIAENDPGIEVETYPPPI